MRFNGDNGEVIFISEIGNKEESSFQQELKTGLSILWNVGPPATLMIDKEMQEIPPNCLIFLTEYHRIDRIDFEQLNVIQFNRPFYCVENDDSEVGCKGLLFFGASSIPKVHLDAEDQRSFEILWGTLMMEIEEMDDLQLEMLKSLLKRFLILSLRIYKMQFLHIPDDLPGAQLIREFNYLVEKHYRKLSRVAEYADLLHKSPKTIANTFRKYYIKSPIQVINERRVLEAKRMLSYTDRTIQEIASSINFKDIQTFSHFFKQHEGISPINYRKQVKDRMS